MMRTKISPGQCRMWIEVKAMCDVNHSTAPMRVDLSDERIDIPPYFILDQLQYYWLEIE